MCSFGQQRHEGHLSHKKYEVGRNHRPSYFVDGDKVFFQGIPVRDASASSFSILRDGYAKDNWNVYYCGIKINDASSNSFKVLGYGYSKDDWNVYYNGLKIDGASSNSFTVLSDWYAKDNWNVYYDGVKIQGASQNSFKVLRDGYARDDWNTSNFYNPDYSTMHPDPDDYRRTLYWNPMVVPDKDGYVQISFFNNNSATAPIIDAQMVTPSGLIGVSQ